MLASRGDSGGTGDPGGTATPGFGIAKTSQGREVRERSHV